LFNEVSYLIVISGRNWRTSKITNSKWSPRFVY